MIDDGNFNTNENVFQDLINQNTTIYSSNLLKCPRSKNRLIYDYSQTMIAKKKDSSLINFEAIPKNIIKKYENAFSKSKTNKSFL
jgi:hypothetical protein